MLHRVAGTLLGFKGITILNDEAHHCDREKPGADPDERAEARNKDAARLWISRRQAAQQTLGLTYREVEPRG